MRQSVTVKKKAMIALDVFLGATQTAAAVKHGVSQMVAGDCVKRFSPRRHDMLKAYFFNGENAEAVVEAFAKPVVPRRVQVGYEIKAADYNALVDMIEELMKGAE